MILLIVLFWPNNRLFFYECKILTNGLLDPTIYSTEMLIPVARRIEHKSKVFIGLHTQSKSSSECIFYAAIEQASHQKTKSGFHIWTKIESIESRSMRNPDLQGDVSADSNPYFCSCSFFVTTQKPTLIHHIFCFYRRNITFYIKTIRFL